MRLMLNKIQERRFVQNLVIELVADLLMLSMGIVIGYYLKTLML